MKYSIDRIEEDNIILENIKTKEIKKIPLTAERKDYKEGMILIETNGKYKQSEKEERKRRKKIQSKLNIIKNNWIII